MALKRKKRLEKQLQQIDGTLSTIEFQREALENANTNTEVLKNMSYAAKALKSAHQQLWVKASISICLNCTNYLGWQLSLELYSHLDRSKFIGGALELSY